MEPRAIITITSNAAQVISGLSAVERQQLPFATALTLTRLGVKVKDKIRAEMPRVFDRPTPWTLNSLMLRKATKQNQEATVWFKDFGGKGIPASTYLPPQVFGGGRSNKRTEEALRRRGFLQPNQQAIPAAGAKLDTYGNMMRSQIVQMLSQTRSLSEMGYTGNAKAGSRTRYFAVPSHTSRNLKPGVYYRKTERSIIPVMIFTNKQKYTKRLPFYEMSEALVRSQYNAEFGSALAYAISTAK